MEQTYDPQKTFDVPPLKFIATKGCTIVSNLLLADTHTYSWYVGQARQAHGYEGRILILHIFIKVVCIGF